MRPYPKDNMTPLTATMLGTPLDLMTAPRGPRSAMLFSPPLLLLGTMYSKFPPLSYKRGTSGPSSGKL
jgi:hypothetical protein